MKKEEVDKLIETLREANEKMHEQKLIAMQKLDFITAQRKETEMINKINETLNALGQEGVNLTKEQKKQLESIHGVENKIESAARKRNKQFEISKHLAEVLAKQLQFGWKYLIESDKTIRQTTLNLGMSGVKADLLRQSFQESARDVAHLGGSLSDIQAIMSGFAEETGMAKVLTSEMITNIEEIAKGTGLSVEEATQLGARFQFMGVDAAKANQQVQDIVDTTERMGVNTTKVLKNVNNNFKRLSTYSFKNGTKAFREMAVSAELTRVSMDSALNVAEAARNLEQVIELGANLQVMGGEFAKMDPLSWMYMARNEPEKMNDEISKMTAGLFTIRKNSEGVFEKFISPADRDRLANVAKSLGISNEEMFEIAQRQTDMTAMSKQLAGTGLSNREKELIKGAAHFNSDSGKFQVKLAGQMKDISTLTKDQAKAFQSEQSLLKDRAVAAQDFDTALKATIEEFKSVLLPMLKGVNAWFEKIRGWSSNLTKLIGGGKDSSLMVGLGVVAVSITLLSKTLGVLNLGINSLFRGLTNKILPSIGGVGKATAGVSNLNAAQTLAQGKASMYAGRGAAMRGIGAGAGVGLAGAGVGAGVGIAAKGIGQLADSMSKLNKDQAETLKTIVWALTVMSGIGAAAAASIMIFGKAGGAAAPGLLKLSLPLLAIGAAIGIATAGIGFMGLGLSKMIDSASNAQGTLLELAGGIGVLSLSMMALGTGFGLMGMLALGGILKTITKHAPSLTAIGDAFKEINTVLSGSAEDFEAINKTIDKLSGLNSKGSNGVLGELIQLLKNPIQVKFDDKEVIIRNNVSLSIDSKRFTADVIHVPTLMEMVHQHQTNKF